MKHILIIIDGILAKHFLERLCFEKGLDYFFTIVYHNEESVDLDLKSLHLEFHKFDPTSPARLGKIMNKAYSQAFIYMQNEFETRKTYEVLRSFDEKLELVIMDFWGLQLDDKHTNVTDARTSLSRRLLDFLPDIALTAQHIGLGMGELMEIKIPVGSLFAYRHISSIQQKRWRIVLIYRNSKIHFVRPSFVLEPNDSILVVGDPVVLQTIFHNIRGKMGQFPIPFGNNIFTLLDMKNMSYKTQELLIETTFILARKSNAKKFFIRIINPKLNAIYFTLKALADENEGIFFDFFNTNFKNMNSFLENNDIGIFLTDTQHFEKEKKMLFELKIPILKIGNSSFANVTESIILSANESEIENNANVITDLSTQLNFNVTLYYYNPNSQSTEDMEEYFRSISRLYDKNVQIINKNDENPILNLQYREDLLHFVSFHSNLLSNGFNKNFSLDLNRHYYKMARNYQLFIPIS
ncbi:potassium transporter TrkA [Campylobacter sp. MIT 21-1685]|uniref:COG3400 family protein n=1 Tax=unclassified Campylobacter TaxID=2593542 RepID=UPI00224B7230|nr:MULTISPECIES: TrkA C-terminal domain-containing protein [unclassified Campylobacter]MCX2682935.1 potassium transporter TrkA [Campylobacter sp. MIT 21-1684]MCX2751217.1 potassium transporter TrkA [Campylobacter sp. MIT 21-1682]MCX2807416.1 potassium transporter TrkA [Campylobacter sp. MIT 21-1685]